MHQFHIDHNEGESVIEYSVIIGRDLMLQIDLMEYFKQQVLLRENAEVPMKDPISLLVQSNLTSCKMCEVEIQTVEPYSTK